MRGFQSNGIRVSRAAAILLLLLSGAVAAPVPAQPPLQSAPQGPARMVVVAGKDLGGAILKKLGLPNRKYCWDLCLADGRCTGVRWGVVGHDEAGLCMMLTGELTIKALPAAKTDDGTPIRITTARKQSGAGQGSLP